MQADLLSTITVAVLTNGSVLALFLWVFKVAFEKALDKRAKLFEKELELEHKKNFHQFSKLYDEQAGVLRDVYAQLVELNDMSSYLAFKYNFYEQNPQLLEQYRLPKTGGAAEWDHYLRSQLSTKPEDEKAEALVKAASLAFTAFRPKRIYLPPATADEVERLINLFGVIGSHFQSVSYRDPETQEQVVAPEVIETWKKVVAATKRLFPQLEEQFRQHLSQ